MNLRDDPSFSEIFILHSWVWRYFKEHFNAEQIVQLMDALFKFTASDANTTFGDPAMFFAYHYGCEEIRDAWDYVADYVEAPND